MTTEDMASVPKDEIYRAIIAKEFEDNALPQAVFILSGGTEYSKERGYYTPSYDEADFTGLASGAHYRVIAAAEIGKNFSDITLVPTGKLITHGIAEKEHFPNDAAVMADELKAMGVKEDQIILEEESVSTLTELVQLVKMARENGWERVAVVTSRWHVPRVKMMYEKLETIEGLCSDEEKEMIEDFKQSGAEVKIIGAEDITDNISQEYRDQIKEIEQREAFKERLAAEQRGIEDLKAGRYKVRK